MGALLGWHPGDRFQWPALHDQSAGHLSEGREVTFGRDRRDAQARGGQTPCLKLVRYRPVRGTTPPPPAGLEAFV
jgi:hypothetical protein